MVPGVYPASTALRRPHLADLTQLVDVADSDGELQKV
jgi:hypothetical protein